MKNKYKPLFSLLIILILAILVMMATSGCFHDSLKGKTVNFFADAGRSNSFEDFKDFINYQYYDEAVKDSNQAGASVAPMPLSNQEIVFAATDGTISLISNKEVIWTKRLDAGNVVSAAMCIDPEQNTYAITNTGLLYSFAYDGKQRWKIKICDSISNVDIPCDLIAFEDGIITGITNGLIKKISFDGKVIWNKNLNNTINKTISSFDNNLLFSLSSSENNNDTILTLNPDGSEKWRKAMGIRLVKYPISNGKNIACCGLRYEQSKSFAPIYYLDLNGNIIWQTEIQNFVPRYLSISQSGDLFVNAFQAGLGEQISKIYRYDKDGKEIWQKNFNFTIPTPILISQTKLAFLGVTEGSIGLYFVGRDEGIIQGIMSFSNESPIIHSATVKPDGSISFGYYQNLGFLTVDRSWFSKIIPW